MLSACSTYFDAILSQHDETNPIVVFKDVRFEDLRALVQFMYKGEIKIENVSYEKSRNIVWNIMEHCTGRFVLYNIVWKFIRIWIPKKYLRNMYEQISVYSK